MGIVTSADQTDGLRILMVEDNPVDAARATGIIEKFADLNPKIDICGTAKDARALLAKNKYDVILSDLHVPDADGLEILEAYKGAIDDTAVVVLSGTYEDEQIALTALQRGAQDYLTKADLDGAHLRRTLRYAVERKEMEKAQRDFLAMTTHELNSPVAAIQGALEMLKIKAEAVITDDLKRYFDIIDRSTERLLNFSRDIHSLAKIEAGNFELNREPVKLNAVFARLKDTINLMALEQNIKLIWPDSPGPASRLDADADRLAQCIQNVLENGIRFAESQVAVRVIAGRDEISIVIEDDGPGIRPTDLPLIFNKFFRGKQTERTRSGSGLGLAIVKSFIEAHGGRITADNRPQPLRGSLFTMVLPVTPRLEKPTVLVVDDEPNVCSTISRILASQGFLTKSAGSGAAAIEILAEAGAEIDLVVTDFQMPQMNGLDLMKKIHQFNRRIPVIFLSGNMDSEQSASAIKSGAFDYFQKPVDFDRLIDACRNALAA